MLLYYAPGLCSLAPHIALRRIGAEFDIEKVDMPTRRTEHGADFRSIKPSGKIPALLLDSGALITATIDILLYFDAMAPRDRQRAVTVTIIAEVVCLCGIQSINNKY